MHWSVMCVYLRAVLSHLAAAVQKGARGKRNDRGWGWPAASHGLYQGPLSPLTHTDTWHGCLGRPSQEACPSPLNLYSVSQVTSHKLPFSSQTNRSLNELLPWSWHAVPWSLQILCQHPAPANDSIQPCQQSPQAEPPFPHSIPLCSLNVAPSHPYCPTPSSPTVCGYCLFHLKVGEAVAQHGDHCESLLGLGPLVT